MVQAVIPISLLTVEASMAVITKTPTISVPNSGNPLIPSFFRRYDKIEVKRVPVKQHTLLNRLALSKESLLIDGDLIA